jgi:hypothetical protein
MKFWCEDESLMSEVNTFYWVCSLVHGDFVVEQELITKKFERVQYFAEKYKEEVESGKFWVHVQAMKVVCEGEFVATKAEVVS